MLCLSKAKLVKSKTHVKTLMAEHIPHCPAILFSVYVQQRVKVTLQNGVRATCSRIQIMQTVSLIIPKILHPMLLWNKEEESSWTVRINLPAISPVSEDNYHLADVSCISMGLSLCNIFTKICGNNSPSTDTAKRESSKSVSFSQAKSEH